jgi:hypothetical protein
MVRAVTTQAQNQNMPRASHSRENDKNDSLPWYEQQAEIEELRAEVEQRPEPAPVRRAVPRIY